MKNIVSEILSTQVLNKTENAKLQMQMKAN